METDQTGFSSSPPTSNTRNGSTNGTSETNNGDHRHLHLLQDEDHHHHQDKSPPPSHHQTALLKEKIKDELDGTEEDGQHLPSITEVEGWRTTTAYYSHPLVAVIDDPTALYDTYKLPSLAKFGKGLTTFGKLPAAIWSVAVTSPEENHGIQSTTAVIASGGSTPTDSPSSMDHQHRMTTSALPSTIYVRGVTGEKERSVIIQQVMPDGSVQLRPLSELQQVMEDEDGREEGKSMSVDDLPPLAPIAVEVKREHHDSDTRSNHDSGGSSEETIVPTSTAPVTQELPLQGAYMETPFEEPNLGTGQYSVLTNVVVTSPPEYGAATGNLYTLTAAPTDYYREYYAQPEQYAQAVRQHLAAAAVAANNPQFPQTNANGSDGSETYVERYARATYGKTSASGPANTGNNAAGMTVDLPSPDSGIGGDAAAAVTPRDAATLHQIFEYADIAHSQSLLPDQDHNGIARPPPPPSASSGSTSPTPGTATASRKTSGTWNSSGSGSDYGRTPEADKVHIPKIFSDVGFRYHLESPISTSQRRDDDRMTYINKGQYYGLTLEYIPDPDRPLRSCTVKTIVMLVFREEKSAEDELKAWKFWHSRQHSVKQRIMDVDTKNSSGVIGQIEEITHNAISFYWNPLEGPAKISVSVHCLSTDFSNQKGVKGLPLHLQIDTTDDLRDSTSRIHRGYCQIKVFCDKGAERKTRDEERRAAKRKLTATPNSRKKLDEMYHNPCERSEFYSMSDLSKPPVLFLPQNDSDTCNGNELTFYTITTVPVPENPGIVEEPKVIEPLPTPPPAKKIKLNASDRELTNMSYPWEPSVLLYAKRADEEVFYPLHLVPPTLIGLAKAVEAKYGIGSDMIRHLYKRCKKGITVEMDDDVVRHYCNEDTFIIDLIKTEDGHFDVTLVEL